MLIDFFGSGGFSYVQYLIAFNPIKVKSPNDGIIGNSVSSNICALSRFIIFYFLKVPFNI